VAEIRACVRWLPAQARDLANELTVYADRIEDPATREEALQTFDEYAWHYKGLGDLIVPGVNPDDWTKRVKVLSRHARASMKARKPTWWQRWFG
jgi:hypothetical protein